MSIKLSPSNSNIGNIVNRTSKTFSVTLTNTSSGKLNSMRTKVGCQSCTTAVIPKANLDAGESMTMTVTFTPTTTAFTITKYVTIFWKGPDLIEKSVQYSFTAKVV